MAVGGLGAVGVVMAARRAGVSVRAWLVLVLTPFLAPDFTSEAAMMQAIERDRAIGPARFPKRLLKRFDLREERSGGDRRLILSRKGDTGRLRLLYLHGGAYILDLQPMQWALATGLLDRLGGEVVASVYPLAPEQGWREGLEAVRRAHLQLVEEVGAENVVVFGDSAGGGLALASVQRWRAAGLPLPRAVVLFSPWLDVGVTGRDQPELETRDPALSIDFLRRAGQLWAQDLTLNDPRVSPLFGDHDGLPPTIVFSGTRDVLDSDALRLAAVNPAVEHHHYRNMIHVWPCAPIPEAGRALDEAADFIRRRLPT